MDGFVDVTEGSNLTLRCTRNSSSNPPNYDMYRWTLPNGSVIPDHAIQSPAVMILHNVSRMQGGVYNCTGIIPSTSSTVTSQITVNVQCKRK